MVLITEADDSAEEQVPLVKEDERSTERSEALKKNNDLDIEAGRKAASARVEETVVQQLPKGSETQTSSLNGTSGSDVIGGSQLTDLSDPTRSSDAESVQLGGWPDHGYFAQVAQNMRSGQVGRRGEGWFLLQALSVLCILAPPQFLVDVFWLFGGGRFPSYGHSHGHWRQARNTCQVPLPLVGELLDLLMGPIALIVGIVFLFLGLRTLGPFLSPFPLPAASTQLVTNGVYSLVRHPMYAGLLLASTGLTKLTCSTTRFVFLLCLWLVLEKKVQVEEGFLADRFGEKYEEYRKGVKKFLPGLY